MCDQPRATGSQPFEATTTFPSAPLVAQGPSHATEWFPVPGSPTTPLGSACLCSVYLVSLFFRISFFGFSFFFAFRLLWALAFLPFGFRVLFWFLGPFRLLTVWLIVVFHDVRGSYHFQLSTTTTKTCGWVIHQRWRFLISTLAQTVGTRPF